MNKRRLIFPYDYALLARKRGFIWLGPTVDKTSDLVGWQCPEGHIWQASYNRIQQGSGCPYCAGKVRKNENDYQQVGLSRSIEWAGTILPPNTGTKTLWKCQANHRWEAPYSDIRGGHGCPYCANLAPLTEHDYIELALSRSIEWIGTRVPKTTREGTQWRCSNGHEWISSNQNIKKSRHGCPYCAGNLPKQEEDYHLLGKTYGLIWTGVLPANVGAKTQWQCKAEHVFESSYNGLQGSSGCPICSGRKPKTMQDYHDLAQLHSFEWIGAELPKKVTSKTEWRCKNGHEFSTRYNSISNGQGCPYCLDMVNGSLASKPQRTIHEMIGGQLNYQVRRYSIDIALERNNIKIAVEYDCWYWHQGKEDHEAKRDAYLIQQGWRILRIKTHYSLPTRAQLDAAIALLLSGETYTEIVLDDWKD